MQKAVVYGFYGKGNLGDDLFMDAFKTLWPEIDFKFTSRLENKDLVDVDAVFFGGGSFLYAMPNVATDLDLSEKKVFYVGVGAETDIHPWHAATMVNADLVAIRTPEFLDKVKLVSMGETEVIGIPDIVFAIRRVTLRPKRKQKSVTVIPNSELIPRASDPHWKHVAWESYKNEFAQALDYLVKDGFNVSFRSFCENAHMSDGWAASELVARMDNRRTSMSSATPLTSSSFAQASYLLSSVVVTQRLHGAVLAEITNTPYVIVHHHDKLKTFQPCRGVKLPYYESSKSTMLEAIKQAYEKSEEADLSGAAVEFAQFSELQEKVRTILAT